MTNGKHTKRCKTEAKLFSLAYITAAVLCIVMSIPVAAQQNTHPDDILILVHKSVPESEITEELARDYFLKIREFWANGKKIIPVNAKDTSLRNALRDRVLKMSEGEENLYWQKLKITKGVQPPVAFSNPQKALFHMKGSIGYVYRKDLLPNVFKVVLVIPSK